VGTGGFAPLEQGGWSVKLITYLNFVLRLRKRGALPSLPYTFKGMQRKTIYFTLPDEKFKMICAYYTLNITV
jgi:hypothetical protein